MSLLIPCSRPERSMVDLSIPYLYCLLGSMKSVGTYTSRFNLCKEALMLSKVTPRSSSVMPGSRLIGFRRCGNFPTSSMP